MIIIITRKVIKTYKLKKVDELEKYKNNSMKLNINFFKKQKSDLKEQ